MSNTIEAIQYGANFGAQILGLLAIWKQESKSEQDDHFQEFIIWLENHNFNALSERIYDSEELQRELHSLLAGDLKKIEQRLDNLCTQVSWLIGRTDDLRDVGRAIASDQETISPQAGEILKLFADSSGDDRLLVSRLGSHGIVFLLLPSQRSFRMTDQRFVGDDLELLATENLLRLDDYSGDGHPIYTLTRKGEQLARQLPPVEVIDNQQ